MLLMASATEIVSQLCERHPASRAALDFHAKEGGRFQAQLLGWQAVLLHALARKYNYEGARLLDIGTAGGFSCAVMAMAAPEARVLTLNPRADEMLEAWPRLAVYPNVGALVTRSQDYLARCDNAHLDLVFVDGNHKRVALDLPWYEKVKAGGMMVFHDYSPQRCPPVYEAVNMMAKRLGREPDVLVMDEGEVGMAAFHKTAGEVAHG